MDAKSEKNPEASWRATSGRLLAGFALIFCVPVGALFVSVATGAVGIVLGIAGYALGARTSGLLAIVLCMMAMFVGLLVGQGVIPGDAYDRLVDGWFRDKPTAHFAND